MNKFDNNSLLCVHRVRAYGPGIEPIGPVVGAPANFTVETFSAGKGTDTYSFIKEYNKINILYL